MLINLDNIFYGERNMKKRITAYIEEHAYKEFKIQCAEANQSVSKRLNNFIKSEVRKRDEEKK